FRMRAVLVIALVASIALAKKPCTDEDRKKYDEIRQAKLEKLSPEAQAAGKKIHGIFQAEIKAAHEEVHALLETLPESIRTELKSLKGGARGDRKPLTEEQKAEFHAILKEKLEKLSDEAKAAAKQIHEIRKANKDDKKAAKEQIDKVLEGLSESVRDELKSLRPKHHRGQRTSTPKAG
ncbi:hypothetical protein PENTCL1PPCAC_25481, partial [Pristionchus entomophagus]